MDEQERTIRDRVRSDIERAQINQDQDAEDSGAEAQGGLLLQPQLLASGQNPYFHLNIHSHTP